MESSMIALKIYCKMNQHRIVNKMLKYPSLSSNVHLFIAVPNNYAVQELKMGVIFQHMSDY